MIHDFGNRNRHLGIHHLHRSDHYLDACIEKKHSRVHGHRFSYRRVIQWISAFPGTLGTALLSASKESSFLATMLFLLMSVIMTKTGMIARLVELLNSIIGRIKGGAAYVSVCASFLFGLVSGNAIANCATVGAITVPWMKESGWPKEVSATMNAGNAGVGQSMPSCTAMFLLLGLAPVAAAMTVGQAYIAVLCGGAWTFVYRLIRVWLYAKKYNVQAVPEDQIKPFGQSFHDNWTSC